MRAMNSSASNNPNTQNGILAKHVDTMRTAIAKLETETAVQAENNASMQVSCATYRALVKGCPQVA